MSQTVFWNEAEYDPSTKRIDKVKCLLIIVLFLHFLRNNFTIYSPFLYKVWIYVKNSFEACQIVPTGRAKPDFEKNRPYVAVSFCGMWT